jgi:hypothetical protein
VALKIAGKLEVENPTLALAADGTLTLHALDAETHGEQLKYESGDGKDNLGYWTVPSDWAEWQFNITKAGKFTVTAEIAAQGSGSFELSVGNQKLTGTAPNTGDYAKFQAVDLGTLEISSTGRVSLAVHPVADGWQPLNLKSIKLTPVP